MTQQLLNSLTLKHVQLLLSNGSGQPKFKKMFTVTPKNRSLLKRTSVEAVITFTLEVDFFSSSYPLSYLRNTPLYLFLPVLYVFLPLFTHYLNWWQLIVCRSVTNFYLGYPPESLVVKGSWWLCTPAVMCLSVLILEWTVSRICSWMGFLRDSLGPPLSNSTPALRE